MSSVSGAVTSEVPVPVSLGVGLSIGLRLSLGVPLPQVAVASPVVVWAVAVPVAGVVGAGVAVVAVPPWLGFSVGLGFRLCVGGCYESENYELQL